MTDPDRVVVLLTTPCEWCSTGLYRRRMAEVQVAVLGADARLCRICAVKVGGPAIPLEPVADTLSMLKAGPVGDYLAGQAWTVARSVPEYPHEYLLLSNSTDPLMHLRVVRFIRANGERREWAPRFGPAAGRRAWCHYWPTHRWEYWTQPNRSDPILNRRPADAESE